MDSEPDIQPRKIIRSNIMQGLYVITDNQTVSYRDWPDRAEQVIRGGASMIQLRDKQLADDELYSHACVVQEICHHYNVLFIMNDRIELAKKIRAHGVHIGRHDSTIRQARTFLGNEYLIGASCYRNLNVAIRAQSLGADYVAFGSIYPSHTKMLASRCPLSVLRNAKKVLSIPVCAIGGINSRNMTPVLATGIDMVAASHAVFGARYPRQAATEFTRQVIMRQSNLHLLPDYPHLSC